MVEQLFLAVPWGCLQFVIVVYPDHTLTIFERRVRLLKAKELQYFPNAPPKCMWWFYCAGTPGIFVDIDA